MATTDTTQRTIDVENPASGATIGSVPVLAERDVQELATRARMAQPTWAAMGFEGRARVFDAARRWLIANTPRVIETICSETGKTYEDATLELSIAALGMSTPPSTWLMRRSPPPRRLPWPARCGSAMRRWDWLA